MPGVQIPDLFGLQVPDADVGLLGSPIAATDREEAPTGIEGLGDGAGACDATKRCFKITIRWDDLTTARRE